MPDLRRDPVTGELVLFAPRRAARPHTIAVPPPPPAATTCPFDPGHEDATPPEVFRTGSGPPDEPGWRVRVTPNLYPIVGGPDATEGARGAHEVVVLSPDHDRSFGMLDDEQAVEVLTVMRDRARHHADAGCEFVQVFINHGRAGGASIAHPHGQIIALEFVPPVVEALATRMAAADNLLDIDRTRDPKLIVHDGPAPTWCPWASSAQYTMRLAPPDPNTTFDNASDASIREAALASRGALSSLRTVLDDPAYNLVVHTAPPARSDRPYWFVEIRPRTTVIAGFELGTNVLTNTVLPEIASEQLRNAWPDP